MGIPIHFGLCWLFTFTLGYGFYGIPYAMVLTHFIMMVAFHVYTLRLDTSVKNALEWPGLNVVLSNWKEYLALGVPGAVMISLEWLCFEFMVIMSGWLGIA